MGKAFVVDMELVEFIINGVGLIWESGWVLRARFVQKFPPAGWVTGFRQLSAAGHAPSAQPPIR